MQSVRDVPRPKSGWRAAWLVTALVSIPISQGCQQGVIRDPLTNDSDGAVAGQDAQLPPGQDAQTPPSQDAAAADAYVPPQPDAAVADAYVPPQPDASTATWTAPDFTLRDVNPQSSTNGQSLTLSDNLGKVVVVTFVSFT